MYYDVDMLYLLINEFYNHSDTNGKMVMWEINQNLELFFSK